MAGNNASEIRIAGSGRILVADVGATAPADFTSPWTGWIDLGYTTGDGVTFSKKDKLDPVETWQAVSPVRLVYSDRDLTLKFALMQFNEATLPFFMGGGQTNTEASVGTDVYSYHLADGPGPDERALALEFTDNGEVTYRFIVPRGQVTASDDIKFARKAASTLGITFTALSPGDGSPLATFLMKDAAYAS